MYRCLRTIVATTRGVYRSPVNNGHITSKLTAASSANHITGRQQRQGIMGTSQSRSPAVTDFINKTVKDNCVVIFSKTTCSYCRLAKRVFEDIGTPYHAVELNKREDGPEIQHVLSQMTGDPTVPRVFINGECIGGGTETKNLQNKGKLVTLLQQCATE